MALIQGQQLGSQVLYVENSVWPNTWAAHTVKNLCGPWPTQPTWLRHLGLEMPGYKMSGSRETRTQNSGLTLSKPETRVWKKLPGFGMLTATNDW